MNHSTLRMLLLTAIFAALTAVGAFLRIPVGYSSFTLQLLFTCFAGVILGPCWGAVSQAVYVLSGLAGLPIFTAGGGLMYVAEPTFGFLLGLIPTALVIGLLMRKLRLRLWLRIALSCCAGVLVLYAVALPYFYFALGKAWSMGRVLVSCCLIFLPFDALKIFCVTLIGKKLLPLLSHMYM